jgi:hypothetical protein
MNATTEMMDPGSLRVWSAIRIRVRFGRTVVRATIAPVVLAFAACTASPTTATLINVDFNSSGPGTSVGTFSGTGVLGGGTWNGVAVNQNAQALASTALLDSAGAASGISVAIPAYQGAWNLADQPASSWKPLLGDWVYLTAAGQSSATIILSGLGSSTAWDLVFYAANGIGEGSDFTIGAITQQTTDSSSIGSTLTAGDEYVVFNNVVSDGSGTISIGWNNYGTASALNGLQIQAVPEPSSTVAIALAMVAGITAYRARKRCQERMALS